MKFLFYCFNNAWKVINLKTSMVRTLCPIHSSLTGRIGNGSPSAFKSVKMSYKKRKISGYNHVTFDMIAVFIVFCQFLFIFPSIQLHLQFLPITLNFFISCTFARKRTAINAGILYIAWLKRKAKFKSISGPLKSKQLSIKIFSESWEIIQWNIFHEIVIW